jgi:acyl-Coa thioesterase superfamily protein/acyl-CoA thioesterase superfamily protein
VSDSIFIPSGDGRFEPTEHARGPWDPHALHGGAPAALIAGAFERIDPGSELPIARLGFEFLRPIPFAPLELSTKIVRAGRRVQGLAAELRSGGEAICTATALRVQAVADGLPAPSALSEREPLAQPESGEAIRFALGDPTVTSFASTAMEMRWLSDPWTLGPGKVWMRLRHPVLPEEPLTPLMCLTGTADFGNGVSAALAFEDYLFINADLSIHLWRQPRGAWVGLDARTLLHGGGIGTAESVLHDAAGPVGRASQTLVVQPR